MKYYLWSIDLTTENDYLESTGVINEEERATLMQAKAIFANNSHEIDFHYSAYDSHQSTFKISDFVDQPVELCEIPDAAASYVTRATCSKLFFEWLLMTESLLENFTEEPS